MPSPRFFRRSSRRTARCPAAGFLLVMALIGALELCRRHVLLPARRLAGDRLPRPRRAAGVLGVPRQLPRRRGLRGGDRDAARSCGCAGSATAARWRNGRSIRCGRSSIARRHEEYGLLRLFLVSRGRRLAVAGFLSPQEKESFAAALGDRAGRGQARPDKGGVSDRDRGQESGGIAASRGLDGAHDDGDRHALARSFFRPRAAVHRRRRLRHRAPRHRPHPRQLAQRSRRSSRSPRPPASRRPNCTTCSAAGPGSRPRPSCRRSPSTARAICCATPRACWTPPTRSACPAPAGCTTCSSPTRRCRPANGRPAAKGLTDFLRLPPVACSAPRW